MPLAIFYLTLASAVGAGLIAGVFFAFSNFVMPALVRLPPAQGLAAMQSINVTVLNRTFLSVFTGTAVLCSVLALLSVVSWSMAGSKLRIAGGALYVFGTFIVTMVCNVPLNDRMARISPAAAEAAHAWSQFVQQWGPWNTVRSLAALGAALALTIGLVQSAQP